MTEANTGDISVKLEARTASASGEEVIADVRAKIKEAEPVLDLEFPQLLQDMIGDLTSAPEPCVIKLFAQDPERAAPMGAAGRRRDQEDPGRGGYPERNREHHQRPRHDVQRRSRGGRARRIHAAGSGAGRERDSAGRAGHHARGGQRPVVHDPRPLPATTRAPTMDTHPQHAARQRHRARPRRSARSPIWSRSPGRPKSAAKICSATCRSPRDSKA